MQNKSESQRINIRCAHYESTTELVNMFEATWPYLYHCKLQAAANSEPPECEPRAMTPLWDDCSNLFVYKMSWAAYDNRLRKNCVVRAHL